MARSLYEATENLARVEVSARTALFQAMLCGGIAGIAANVLFPQRAGHPGAGEPPRPPVTSRR